MRDWRVWVIAGVMGLTAILFQIAYLTPKYILSRQVFYHQLLIKGEGPRPTQYRILSDYLLQAGIDAADRVFPAPQGITRWTVWTPSVLNGKPNKEIYVLVDSSHFFPVCLCFRVLQNIAILLLLGIYLGRLEISGARLYAGMMALAWGLFFAFKGSDLQFNTYTDVIIFLLAGIALASWDSRSLMWLIPISILGAANRETSIFIPLLALARIRWYKLEEGWPGTKRYLWIGLAALGAWVLVYGALVMAFPGKGWSNGVDGTAYGWEVFQANFRGIMPWMNFIATLGVFPMLAVLNLARDKGWLRTTFWVMIPAWFTVMLFMGNVEETRIFLVPQAMVFIPLAMREGK